MNHMFSPHAIGPSTAPPKRCTSTEALQDVLCRRARQAVGQKAAGGARPNDDVVENFCHGLHLVRFRPEPKAG